MNHMKFCGCGQCRRGMHASQHMKKRVMRVVRRMRRVCKVALRKGWDADRVISVTTVPYTD